VKTQRSICRHEARQRQTFRCIRAALTIFCTTACVDDPSNHQQVMHVSVDSSTSLVSGARASCAEVSVTFNEPPPSGSTVTLSTTVGVLEPSTSDAGDSQQITLTTSSAKTLSAFLCPGTSPGTGTVTAAASGIAPATSTAVTVKDGSAAILFLIATDVDLHAPGQTSSTLEVSVVPATALEELGTTRVGFLACCNPDAQTAGATPNESCASDLSVPSFVDTSSAVLHQLTATASLTADGRAFTRARADQRIRERDVSVYAYLPNGQSPKCSDLLAVQGTSGDSWHSSSVVLRLTTRSADQTGESGAGP
jgi:hypothetical protein